MIRAFLERRQVNLSMDITVFAAVLGAALMHAGWNAIVKVGLDRFSSIILLSGFQSAIAVLLLGFFPLPAQASWPWIAGSALLHSGYKIFLIRAYEHGDLSQVYPLARGSAPLIVALAGAWALGESLTPIKFMAVLAIGLGVIVMSLKGGANLTVLPAKALLYALITAAFTAAYTLADGVGARLSATAAGFTFWLFLWDGVCMALYAVSARGPGVFVRLRPAWKSGVVAGALSLGSYGVAIWAFTQAPIALVAALRETSVLFAVGIAVLFLKERAGAWRYVASGLIFAGVLLIRL